MNSAQKMALIGLTLITSCSQTSLTPQSAGVAPLPNVAGLNAAELSSLLALGQTIEGQPLKENDYVTATARHLATALKTQSAGLLNQDSATRQTWNELAYGVPVSSVKGWSVRAGSGEAAAQVCLSTPECQREVKRSNAGALVKGSSEWMLVLVYLPPTSFTR